MDKYEQEKRMRQWVWENPDIIKKVAPRQVFFLCVERKGKVLVTALLPGVARYFPDNPSVFVSGLTLISATRADFLTVTVFNISGIDPDDLTLEYVQGLSKGFAQLDVDIKDEMMDGLISLMLIIPESWDKAAGL